MDVVKLCMPPAKWQQHQNRTPCSDLSVRFRCGKAIWSHKDAIGPVVDSQYSQMCALIRSVCHVKSVLVSPPTLRAS